MEIRTLAKATITDAELADLTAFADATDPDRRPGDPAFAPEAIRVRLDVASDRRCVMSWGAWHDGVLVGAASYEANLVDDNLDGCEVIFGVHPDHRRRGYGRAIFAHLLAYAESQHRTIVHPWTELNEASRGFFAAHDFDVALDERISRLVMSDVDADLMQAWVDAAADRAAGYHLERWVGRCPDHLAEAYVQAIDGMNEAPHDDLTIERSTVSVDRMRDGEARREQQGIDQHVILAVETSTGRGAACTDTEILHHREAHSWQGNTTTLIEHRNRGLARWIKAAMWQWLRAERPGVATLDTGNADSNAAMLSINVAMGYRPTFHYGCFQHRDIASAESTE